MFKGKPTADEITAWAKLAYNGMNDDEKHGCKFGLFPAEVMAAALRNGINAQTCAVALMKEARSE